jgi:tetratricopeptide (TPR) repeat protein
LRIFQQDVFYLSSSCSYYRPILTLSFMLDAQISGQYPFFYHLSNVLYHLTASLLFYLFLKKLKIEEKVSFLLALIFLVHPVLTQAVSWIPGRNDSLLTIFTLATFIFLIEYLEKRKITNLIFYFLFFFLSLFTKESAILIPLFSIFFILLFYKEKSNYFLELFLGWWGIGFFWFIARQNALKNFFYLSPSEMTSALIFNFPALFLYLGKIFFPFNLSVLPTLKDSIFFWGFLALLVFILFLWWSKKINFKLFVFGFLWFLFFLFPNFIRPNSKITADFLEHRIYLPLVGFLVIFVSLEKIKKIFLEKKIFVFFVIIFFSVITFFHQFDFKDRLTFWQKAVFSSPSSPLAHRNLGAMLYFDGKIVAAEKEYEKSLEINPNEPMANNNLGVIYLDKKQLKKAIVYFERELKINPNYDNALFNLGLAYYQLG